MTSKNKEFAKNTFILALGRIATQFTSFLMIPLFTHFLNADDYGTVDLIQSYITLLVPVLILRFDSSVFRFLIDERKNEDKSKTSEIITSSLLTIILMALLFGLICLGVSFFIDFQYLWLAYINTVAIMFSNIFLQIARGFGENKEYSIASAITGITILIVNSVLILCFGFNAGSILIASSVGNIICTLYLAYAVKINKYCQKNKKSKAELKRMLKYSLPMIPNSLSWWVVNVSDRTLIAAVLGAAANGIYAVSCKFSGVINSIFSIFNISWQETASVHINDKDSSSFFTEMINNLLFLFSNAVVVLIGAMPLIFDIIIGQNYLDAYVYIPILLIANIFDIAIQLFGGVYVARKETKKIMRTTIAAAIINLIVDFALIFNIGLYAAAISTLVAYASMAIYRYFDIRKNVKITLDKKRILFSAIFLAVATAIFYMKNIIASVVFCVIFAIVFVLVNRATIKSLLKDIKIKK